MGNAIMSANSVVNYLQVYGGLKAGFTNEQFKEAVANLQQLADLPVTGQVDANTEKVMLVSRCGRPDIQAAGRPKWGKNKLTVFVYKAPKLAPPMELYIECVRQACNRWSAVCNISFVLGTSREGADIVFDAKDIDGPFNTLAYTYLPPMQNIPLFMDNGENWDKSWGPPIIPTHVHELGHCLGLEHGGKGIMQPFLSEFVQPQVGYDINEVVARYGSPVLPPVTPPTTPPVTPPTTPPTTPPSNPPSNPQTPDDAYVIRVSKQGGLTVDGFLLMPRR